MALWAYESDSYFGSCNKSVLEMSNKVSIFEQFLAIPFSTSVKDTSFAFVTILEYPYPISTFCYSATFEVKQDVHNRKEILTRHPGAILENIMRKLGTILLYLVTIPDCLVNGLDGVCIGAKAGAATNLIFLA